MSQLGASSFKDGRTRWAVPVNPGSCQTERRTLADISVLIGVGEWFCDKSLVGRCQIRLLPSHNTFGVRIVRLNTVRPDAISSEDPLQLGFEFERHTKAK